VAGIITIAKGHDASYPWRQIGTAEPVKDARSIGKGVRYYLSPAEKGGEPPGIWTGKGVANWDSSQEESLSERSLSGSTGSTWTLVTRQGRRGWAGRRAGTGQQRRSTQGCWPLSRKRQRNGVAS